MKKNTRDFSAMGKKGGYRRALALSPERRKEIAKKAINTRWEKRRQQSTGGT